MELPIINFGGLASGIDTNAIVDALIAVQRRPQVRVRQQQVVEQARHDVLRDVKTRLVNLQSEATRLRDASTWGDVQTIESSDESKLTATRTGGGASGAYDIVVTQLARAQQVRQAVGGATSASADGTLDISTATGTAFSVAIASGDDLDAIASKINSTSDIPVYATVVSDRLYLSGRKTGVSETISVASTALADELKLNTTGAANLAETTITAQSANLTVNGTAHVSESNTVADAIAGASLTLKTTTTGATVTIGAPTANTDKVKQVVEDFVKQYNSTVTFIRDELNEARPFSPEDDEQRRQGVLRGDTALNSLLSSLRAAVADVFTDGSAAIDQLSEVGLSTGGTTGAGAINSDSVNGLLTLDADALVAKLNTNFSEVKALFTRVTDTYATEGFSQRIGRLITPFTEASGLLESRKNAADTRLSDLRKREERIELRLEARERLLRAQFTAMEMALARAQSQGAYLSASLARLR